jgi:tetratricopeptide (TPR) repeat protein
MVTPGRNAPCPCGSGKKHKRCCLAPKKRKAPAPSFNYTAVYTELDQLSNSVNGLIKEGKLDEAEAVANRLLKEYPDQIDGFDRLSQVYEARGEKEKAVEYLQKAADFAASSEGFDQQSVDWFLSEINRLKKEV